MEAGRWFSMWEKWVGGVGAERERERERLFSTHMHKKKMPSSQGLALTLTMRVGDGDPQRRLGEVMMCSDSLKERGRRWVSVIMGSGLVCSMVWSQINSCRNTHTQLTKTKQTPKHGNLFGRHSLCFWFLIRYHFRHDTFNFLAPPSPHPKKKLQLKVSLNITSPISQRSVLISLHQFLNVYINYYNWDDCCHHKKGLGC